MNSEHAVYAGFVALYLGALIGVGALKARKIKNQADFSLAGRGLGSFVLVGTLLATWIGTGSIFGNSEETLNVGLAALLLPLAGAVGIIALYVLAPRVRRLGQFTIQDILEQRFGPAARVMGTITLVCAYVIIVSYQYRAGASIFDYLFPGLGDDWAILIVAAFVILYTALAGMFSVAYTDVANGILMILGIGLALPLLYSQAGGVSGVFESLEPAERSIFGHYTGQELIGVLLPPFLLLLGDANMYQRFFAARDPAAARRSAIWMLVGVLVLEYAIIATALAGKALVAQGKISAPEEAGKIVVLLGFEALPTFLGAMLIATVLAIIVSTADSYLLSPATSLVRDVYQRFMAPAASDRRMVSAGRWTVVFLGLIALGLAYTSQGFFRLALFAYTIYGAGITPPLMAAFFWKRATPAGAVSAMLGGVTTAMAWQAADLNSAFGLELDPVIPAAALNILLLVVVSLCTSPKATAEPG